MSILKQLIKENWFNKQFGFDDEDDLSPSERELIKRSEKELKAKGIDVDEELPIKKKTTPASETPKKQTPNTKPSSVKKEEPTEKVKRARGEISTKIREWIKANPEAKRKDFITFAVMELGISVPHANTMFYSLKKKLTEYYIISHPSHDLRVLCEFDSYTTKWTEFEDPKARDAMIFETKEKAFNALEEIGAGKVIKIVVEQ
jgi:hypothetical protein